ncbi:23S rRNA (pseudouridine(1915)-N(3))-methyltransferase RlmH [Zongyangia hominis]|uniref:Ribosomal RNA large subunit methyltransferase H n=1 Tax=Zongyangia hominis TaxID=2763677 RepID=A0A926ECS5_9FIRM|nr:23S rRNA (pseudouridine(1915)-N(3))-methyltransferase RlmH [Zongyangia hominis]MBC8569382.1 23S rRNA (pseudouridine(1915)-N(3))-methyltransferase RlmH [Zongyangia hominis]
MVGVHLICVGKLKEKYLSDAVAEYAKRLSAFCKLQIVELPECRVGDRPSAAQIEKVMETEGNAILQKVPQGAFVIPMCIEGKLLSSPKLAQTLESAAVGGKSQIAFIIGGSFGLSEQVKARGDLRLSMSPMTFPHQLARVMVLEQIYRAFSIQNHTQYHK